jgi:hypothetical protein
MPRSTSDHRKKSKGFKSSSLEVWRIPWKADRLDVDLLLGVLSLAALWWGTKAPSNLPSCVSGTEEEEV